MLTLSPPTSEVGVRFLARLKREMLAVDSVVSDVNAPK